LEPFSLIRPWGGDRATSLRHFVVKLPIRTRIGGKQVSSTAVLTNNRLLLGVGTALAEDYTVCASLGSRGKRMDEQIAVMRA